MQSCFVDCSGLRSFAENLEVTEAAYRRDVTIPDDIPFEAAWSALVDTVDALAENHVIPFEHPMPD